MTYYCSTSSLSLTYSPSTNWLDGRENRSILSEDGDDDGWEDSDHGSSEPREPHEKALELNDRALLFL